MYGTALTRVAGAAGESGGQVAPADHTTPLPALVYKSI